jgi:hypothetical protein
MALTLALIAGAHALALAATLAMARHDHQLVDDAGRPIEGDWHELRIPARNPNAAWRS